MWKDSCYFVSVEHTRRISLSLPSSPWPTRPIDGFQLVYTGLYWYLTPIFNVYCPNLMLTLCTVCYRGWFWLIRILPIEMLQKLKRKTVTSAFMFLLYSQSADLLTEKVPFVLSAERDVPWIGGTLFQYLSIISIIVDELVFSQTKGVLGVTIPYKLVSIINRWIWSGIESMKLSMFNSARNFWYPAILSGLGILLV